MDENRLRAELMMLKSQHKKLELEFNKKSTLEKLSYIVCSNIKLMYLKYFEPKEYKRILKLQTLTDNLKNINLNEK